MWFIRKKREEITQENHDNIVTEYNEEISIVTE